MENQNRSNQSAGESKVAEYVNRIRGGEDKDSILNDLPDSFKKGIEKGLEDPIDEVDRRDEMGIPPQYKGLDADTLEFIWTIPIYVDRDKNERLNRDRTEAIAHLKIAEAAANLQRESEKLDEDKLDKVRNDLGIEKPLTESIPLGEMEKRKKLHGWEAGYELARVAIKDGVDLAKMSREEYADFAIQNSLAIDDSQLRMAPAQRMATSIEDIVRVIKKGRAVIDKSADLVFAHFAENVQRVASGDNRIYREGIKVRQGTKNSNSWLYFGINKSIGENSGETFKSYVSVKDLNTLTPEKFTELMISLRDAGYNGDIKIFLDMSLQGTALNDQIVMHGATESDAKLALQVAESFFGEDLDQKSFGKDEVIDGKNMSYSEILAGKIKKAVKGL